MKTRFVALSMLVAVSAPFCNPLFSQGYPSKPVRLVLPSPPGGGTDITARIVARALADGLGGQVVVDNRGGASGRIGVELVAKSPPDGYVLLLGGVTPLATIPAAVSNLGYDPVRDFVPISMVAISDYLLVAHPSLQATTVKELIALARSRPGQINFASVGNLSGAHVAGELLKQLAKIDVVHVPYNGGAPAVRAVLTGETSFYFSSGPTSMPYVQAGRLRAIAGAGAKRSRAYPNLPTIAETLPGFEATQWYGVLAPAGTPGDIISRLHAVIVKEMNTPGVVQQITATGADPIVSSSSQEFSAFMKAEIAKWSKVAKARGISLE
jgi:tripartite-type tricarboxylate transporter receptor subunit TctC